MLAARNRPNDETDDGDFDLNKPRCKAPIRGGLIASVPYYPIDPKTAIPENVVKYFQSSSHDEGMDEAVDMNTGNTATKRDFQSFNENEGLDATTSTATEKKRLTQEESMMRFRQRYPLSPKMTNLTKRYDLSSPVDPEQGLKPVLQFVPTKGQIPKRGLQNQQEFRARQTLNSTKRLSSSGAQPTRSRTSQLSLTVSPRDMNIRISLQRRLQFEEASLAEIERLMARAEDAPGEWHEHLFEKATHSCGKIQGLQGALNTLGV